MSDETTDLDIGDTGQVQRRSKDLRLSSQEEGHALSQLLGTAPGRRFVYSLLEGCHVFRTSFNESVSAMAFAEGERNVGLRLLAAIQQHCPSRYLEMIQEANDERSSGNRAQPQPQRDPGSAPFGRPELSAWNNGSDDSA